MTLKCQNRTHKHILVEYGPGFTLFKPHPNPCYVIFCIVMFVLYFCSLQSICEHPEKCNAPLIFTLTIICFMSGFVSRCVPNSHSTLKMTQKWTLYTFSKCHIGDKKAAGIITVW